MRTQERTPAPVISSRTLAEEVGVVLALSLAASAVYAVIDLFEAPVSGVIVASFPQVNLARQLAGMVLDLAPVWLVLHLVRRGDEGVTAIGLGRGRRDAALGVALFALTGLAGLGVYLGSVELGVNRFVVPVPPLGHWWTVPVLLLGSARAALLEEVVVVGYLVTRLRQLRWTGTSAVGASALLRGAYHLYQGWGAFGGNLALGLLFGAVFLRTRRTWPLVVAHFLLDVAAGVGFILFRERLPGFS
jgi:membrane protease YdiL (CAAX protease family)